MLKDLLDSRKCFKIIAGAGNTNKEYIEKLIYVYALAGVRYFDLSADIEVVRTVKKVLKDLRIDAYITVSYGISDDPHVSKVVIDTEKCSACGECLPMCEQNALYLEKTMNVREDNCIGCARCVPMCQFDAMKMVSKPKLIKETLPELVAEGIDTVELHVSAEQENDEIINKWNDISSIYDGMLSLCIDRSHKSDTSLKKVILTAIEGRKPYTTIIQADGCPMSGNDADPSTTLQALAIAQIIERMKIPVYLLMSGGTNNLTSKYAKEFNLSYHGISMGSFARKAIKKYIDDPTFFGNTELVWGAIDKAKELINTTTAYMGGL